MIMRVYLTDGNCIISEVGSKSDLEGIAKLMSDNNMLICDNRIINIRNITYMEVY